MPERYPIIPVQFLGSTSSLAWAAKNKGCQAIVHMPRGSSKARVRAIRDYGAECEVTDYNYDDTVRQMSEMAVKNGWTLVQDTAWPGYEQIPLDIMRGYGTMAAETQRQLVDQGLPAPTHVFLQAGVGSFAAGIIAAMLALGAAPKFIIAEPRNANCVFQSIKHNAATYVNGNLDTIMAGLACGKVSSLAWPILRHHACAAISCPDWVAANGMRILSSPVQNDPRIVSGESGGVTAGLAAWLSLAKDARTIRENLEIDGNSRILLVNTEGDTDPESYRKIAWFGQWPTPVGELEKFFGSSI